jgi:hypothetical protein
LVGKWIYVLVGCRGEAWYISRYVKIWFDVTRSNEKPQVFTIATHESSISSRENPPLIKIQSYEHLRSFDLVIGVLFPVHSSFNYAERSS